MGVFLFLFVSIGCVSFRYVYRAASLPFSFVSFRSVSLALAGMGFCISFLLSLGVCKSRRYAHIFICLPFVTAVGKGGDWRKVVFIEKEETRMVCLL